MDEVLRGPCASRFRRPRGSSGCPASSRWPSPTGSSSSRCPTASSASGSSTRYLPMIEDTLANEVGLAGPGPPRGPRAASPAEPGSDGAPRRAHLAEAADPAERPAVPQRHGERPGERRRSSSTRSSSSRPSSPPRRTAWPTPPPRPSPRRPVAPTTRSSSTATAGWARPTCSTPSGTTSPRTSPPQGPLRHHRDLHERLRRLPAHLDHPGLQAPLPRLRRPPHRRRPVHGAQRGPPRGVLPHLQRPQGRLQADRPHLGPAAQVDRDPRGPAAQPLPLRPHHRDRPARPRDPPGHPALQVR